MACAVVASGTVADVGGVGAVHQVLGRATNAFGYRVMMGDNVRCGNLHRTAARGVSVTAMLSWSDAVCSLARVSDGDL